MFNHQPWEVVNISWTSLHPLTSSEALQFFKFFSSLVYPLAGNRRWHHQTENLHFWCHVLHQPVTHGELPQERRPGLPVHSEVTQTISFLFAVTVQRYKESCWISHYKSDLFHRVKLTRFSHRNPMIMDQKSTTSRWTEWSCLEDLN